MADKKPEKMIKPRNDVIEHGYTPKPPKNPLPKNPPTDGLPVPKPVKPPSVDKTSDK